MEYALGALLVVAVLAFVVLPLLRRRQPAAESPRPADPIQERAAIYRELLELELDQKVGKIAYADFQELSDALLARAAALISQEDAESTTADAAIEREIAETRKSLRRAVTAPAQISSDKPAPSESAPSASTPVEETRA